MHNTETSSGVAEPASLTLETPSAIQSIAEQIAEVMPPSLGAMSNVQDIYPLSSVQEGMLLHYLRAESGDVYLRHRLLAFDDRKELDAYLAALETVVARHDILRTGFFWDGLAEPVQVVLRAVQLPVEDFVLEADGGDAEDQIYKRFGGHEAKLDLRRAPILRLILCYDPRLRRWLMMQVFHHLAFDDISRRILDEEILLCTEGKRTALPVPMQFQNVLAQSNLPSATEEAQAFFSGMLGDIDEPTAPFDLLKSGSSVRVAAAPLDAQLSQRLRAVAKRLNVSPAKLCHLGWALVVAKTSGRQDVVFGTVLAGRTKALATTCAIMGPLINTLPIRVRVAEQSAEAGVRYVDGILGQLLKYRHASLGMAQRCSAAPARTPLFSALFNYRHRNGHTSRFPKGVQQLQRGVQGFGGEGASDYPFSLSVDDLEDGFLLIVQVDSSVDPVRICGFMQTALASLITALETAPETPLFTLEVIPREEREQLVHGWNNTQAEYPAGRCVHELFQAQVERTPDNVALIDRERSLTYADLNRRANQLAHLLIARGVSSESVVGVCIEHSVDMMVGLLGILKAGAAYLPLDPTYPSDRLRFMIADAQPVCILTSGVQGESLLPGGTSILCLDQHETLASLALQSEADFNLLRISSENRLCVIYTSGSTGTPKGVVLEHRNMVNRISWMNANYPFAPGETCCARVSLNFGDSICELFGPLSQGVRIVLMPPVHDLSVFTDTLKKHGVTRLVVVPSLLRTMLESLSPRQLSCLPVEYWFTSGEELPAPLVKAFFNKLPTRKLLNFYGSSEDGADVTWYEVKPDDVGSAIPIGRPIANMRVYVLDAHRRLAPMGVAGELYVSGVGVAREYLNRPDLTAERFIEDPFSGEPGSRMFRTGDMGRWLTNGNLQFLGRNDRQVKIRGFRIELGEIEAKLAGYPGIREAVVSVHRDDSGDGGLVAYYVPEKGHAVVQIGLLREYLSEVLVDYMLPAAYIRLDSLPLTPTGKLDRKALSVPENIASALANDEEPRTATEKRLAAIWKDMMPLGQVGRDTDFFQSGGHSLKAIQLVARIRDVFGVSLTAGIVFSASTLRSMARAIDAAENRLDMKDSRAMLIACPREGSLPLSINESAMWALAQSSPQYRAFNLQLGTRIEGELDLISLQRSLDEVVARHEALRTTYPQKEGRPHRAIAPASMVPIEIVNLTAVGQDGREQKALSIVTETAQAPFDLAEGPLLRVKLLRMAEREHILLLVLHHIIADGWSLGVLSRELESLYQSFRHGETPCLPPLAIQYADYAVWQKKRLQEEDIQNSFAYWKERLGKIPSLGRLPSVVPEPEAGLHRQNDITFTLDADITNALKRFSEGEGVTLFTTLLAAFLLLLCRTAGAEDMAVAAHVSERNRSELEPVIGALVTSLVLHGTIHDNPSFTALLHQVWETCQEAMTHQEAPFLMVRQSLTNSGDLTRIMFNYINVPDFSIQLPGLQCTPFAAKLTTPIQMDLIALIRDKDSGTQFSILYDASRYSFEQIFGFTQQFEGLIPQILQSPQLRVNDYAV